MLNIRRRERKTGHEVPHLLTPGGGITVTTWEEERSEGTTHLLVKGYTVLVRSVAKPAAIDCGEFSCENGR